MNSSLNHVFRIVWNASLGVWQVASEIARGRGKTTRSRRARRAGEFGVAALALWATGATGAELPTDGSVVAGQATITQSGTSLNIHQTSDRATLDWQSFSIGQGHSVNFVQPSASSVALNRVLGSNVSVIQGALNANGHVFLVNQNGILFTPSAQVNVGGIVASTHNISTEDFMAGRLRFSGSSTASVNNQGSISTGRGGLAALIAAKVINSGSITAAQGTVGLASGDSVLLDLGGPVKIQVTQGALRSAIEQGGAIHADGGSVYLTAKAAGDLAASVINHSGVTQALSMAALSGEQPASAGHISLNADIISHSGRLDASGQAAGTNGGHISLQANGLIIDAGTTVAQGQVDGGQIHQRAAEIMQTSAARLDASASAGVGGTLDLRGSPEVGGQAYLSGQMSAKGGVQGGRIDATAHTLTLAGGTADSSGATRAGELRFGGGWQGQDSRLPNAQFTNISNTSSLTNQGMGGKVVVWSDGHTTFHGHLQAAQSAVEVSGKDKLSAYLGNTQAKSLLLDPKNIEIRDVSGGLNVTTLTNPNGNAGDAFGSTLTALSNGNYVITAPLSDLLGATPIADVGRVYLYRGDGTLLSTLSGSTAGDQISSTGVTALSNGNFVVRSNVWDNGSATDAGAVTWGSGVSGVSGVVSASNSLVGSTASDQVGSTGITALANGHYVVRSSNWDNGSATNAGAVTWGHGGSGVSGTVSAANSLVGSTTNDQVGNGALVTLSNGNYVVTSNLWDNGSVADAGAVTWGNAERGVRGTVSASNSLVGSTANDQVGSTGVTTLTNGNYVVRSSNWDSGAVTDVGAVTWGNGNSGVSGAVSVSNSLIGSRASDQVGLSSVTALKNGHYVVRSTLWDNGSASNAGAVTWGNGSSGVSGIVSASNSLVGGRAFDAVGSTGIVELANGNYLVRSSSWGSDTASGVGAVTWANGATGISGYISASNSLVGTTANDGVGSHGVVALTNGNYVVTSPSWDNGSITDAGAVTWGNGTIGTSGTVSAANSLVGTVTNDQIGIGGIAPLESGNYVVRSPFCAIGGIANVGAVTWGDGTSGVKGAVSSANSLVGSRVNDTIGSAGLVRLSNGNYLVRSSSWDNGSATDAGAVTWGSGVSGVSGVVSASNSLVGSTAGDQVGLSGPAILSNGNYVVRSELWDNGSAVDAGAVTWGNGASGVTGVISAANSLVGSTTNDRVGSTGVTALPNGHYVVRSSSWSNGSATSAGAVTWGNGASGVKGAVSAANSLVGSTSNDQVGSTEVTVLTNGNYVVRSANWDNGSLANAGAVTWGNGNSGISGTISASNSIVGSNANEKIGTYVNALPHGKFAVLAPAAGTGGLVHLSDGQLGDTVSSASFGYNAYANSVIAPSTITALLNAGTAVTLQANNDITVTDAVTANNPNGNGGILKLQAGRHITINNTVSTDNGNFLAIAGASSADATQTDAGAPTITLGTQGAINAGSGNISLVANGSGASFVNNSAVATPLQAAMAAIYLPTYNVAATGQSPAQTYFSKGNLGAVGKLYSTSYNQSADTGSCNFAGCSLPTSGTHVFYAATPTITVTPTTGHAITYGDAFAASVSALSGFVDGDSASTAGLSGTASLSISGPISGSGRLAAGSHDIAYSGGLSSSLGYAFADASAQTGELTVAKLEVAVSGMTASHKVYDGALTAILAGHGSVASLSGDVVSVGGSASGSFATKEVGIAKPVTVSGATLYGADAANYNIVQQTGLTADITAKAVSVSGFASANKTYDGSTTAAISSAGSLVGVVGADTGSVSLSHTGASFADKNAGTGKTVTLNGLSLTGAEATNYRLVDVPVTTTADIAQQTLSVSGFASANKTYDGSTAAAISSTGSLVGVIGADSGAVSLSHTGASFADKNAGTGKAITLNGLSLTGAEAANYRLVDAPVTTTADIAQKALSVDGFASGNKTYDGSTSAAVSSTGSLVGVVGADTGSVSLSHTGASFADKNAGTGKTVTLNGLSLTGTEATNYRLVDAPVTTTADIAQKSLSVSGFASANKTYDGSTSAAVSSTGSLVGVVGADTGSVSLSHTGASFADKNAGAGKTVTLNGLSLTGTEATNYRLVDAPVTTTADIAQKSLSVSGFASANKTYDGSTAAAVSSAGSLVGVIGADSGGVSLSHSGASFADKNAGTGKTVTLNGLSLTGTEANNYRLVDAPVTTTADIAQQTLSVSGFASANKTYDGSTAAAVSSSGSLVGVIGADTGSVSLSHSGASFADKNAGTGKTVTLNGLSLTGTEATNYRLVDAPVTTTADIAQKVLNVSGIAAGNKIYDGLHDAHIIDEGQVNTGIAGESLSVLTKGVFIDKNVGQRTVSTTSTLGDGTGGLASNYRLNTTEGSVNATISARPVTVNAEAKQKPVGDLDPALTFVAESARGDRGLLAGEQLVGTLTRQPGEATGSYGIQAGSVTTDNNSNYRIEFAPANLVITTPPTQVQVALASVAQVAQPGTTPNARPSTPSERANSAARVDRTNAVGAANVVTQVGPVTVFQGGIRLPSTAPSDP